MNTVLDDNKKVIVPLQPLEAATTNNSREQQYIIRCPCPPVVSLQLIFTVERVLSTPSPVVRLVPTPSCAS